MCDVVICLVHILVFAHIGTIHVRDRLYDTFSYICKAVPKPTELKIKHKLAPATVRASQGGSGVFVAFV